MSDNTSNNKRIAKNTLLLYFRMLLLMLISLYTSRVILNALGVDDYGIYNVVGGVVSMFSLLSGSLNAAISRFITYELGTGDKSKLKKIFSSAGTIQICIALIFIILAESVGLWFVNYKMVIPSDRLVAANWCFQFSIITFAINLINVPYNATIIAHERMSAFAYISILEALGKLSIAWVIVVSPIDRLVFYSLLLMVVALCVVSFYMLYCKRNFDECRYTFIYDHELLKRMFGFAGWNFIGASSSVLRDQGGNIIINLFCGPAVNAARGIAMQVNNAVNGFVNNFMTAINPQITKSYASEDYDYMMKLIFQGARLSYYILLLLSLPIIITAPYLIEMWLGQVPEHTVSFVRLVLIFSMSESLANPLVTAMLATGNIRNYQIVVGGLQLLNLPFSYIFLKLGYSAECVFVIAIIISIISEFSRLVLLRHMINISINDFFTKVYLKVIIVTIASAFIPIYIESIFEVDSFLNFVVLICVTVLFTAISILFIGCDKRERLIVVNQARKLSNKLKVNG